MRWSRAQSRGVDPSSATDLLCELGRVTQPLSAFSWSRDGSHGSTSPGELLKELNKPNTHNALRTGPAHSEPSVEVGCYSYPAVINVTKRGRSCGN